MLQLALSSLGLLHGEMHTLRKWEQSPREIDPIFTSKMGYI